MPLPTLPQISFTGGELSPSLHSRIDIAKFDVGLRKSLNGYPLAHGLWQNRSGFLFVGEIADSGSMCRLIPFEFSVIQAYILEFTHEKMRIIKDGGYVVYPVGHGSAGEIVEISSPYGEEDLGLLKFVQSADVMTICHPDYAPRELSRTDHHAWTFGTVSFQPAVSAPTGLSGSWQGDSIATSTSYRYKVVAVADDTLELSLPSATLTVNGDSSTNWNEGEYIRISWSAVSGASKYYVYKDENGIFAYIGTAEGTLFKDTKLEGDTKDTPPELVNPFTGAGKYPCVPVLYEQRRWFFSTVNQPQTFWGTQIGNYKNLNTSFPTKDSDGVEFTIDSRKVNQIRNVAPLSDMLVLTSGGNWLVTGGDAAITPGNIQVKPQGGRGCADVPPLIIDDSALYVQYGGKVVRDIGYRFESDAYTGSDLTILATHLFKDRRIKEWAYQENPDSLIWCVMDDGSLLSLTYNREQQVWAWAQHTTDGDFESIASIREDEEDGIYVVVKRTIDGAEKRYVEKLSNREDRNVVDAFYVDSGLSYEGSPVETVSGLGHLEGKEVAILADGNVMPRQTVSGGSVAVGRSASKIHVGLPYVSDLVSLDIEGQGSLGQKKKVSSVIAKLYRSRGMEIATSEERLTPIKQAPPATFGGTLALETADRRLTVNPTIGRNVAVHVRQANPLPLALLAIIPEVG